MPRSRPALLMQVSDLFSSRPDKAYSHSPPNMRALTPSARLKATLSGPCGGARSELLNRRPWLQRLRVWSRR